MKTSLHPEKVVVEEERGHEPDPGHGQDHGHGLDQDLRVVTEVDVVDTVEVALEVAAENGHHDGREKINTANELDCYFLYFHFNHYTHVHILDC